MRVVIDTSMELIAGEINEAGWDADVECDHVQGRLSDVVRAVVSTMYIRVNDEPAMVVVK